MKRNLGKTSNNVKKNIGFIEKLVNNLYNVSLFVKYYSYEDSDSLELPNPNLDQMFDSIYQYINSFDLIDQIKKSLR